MMSSGIPWDKVAPVLIAIVIIIAIAIISEYSKTLASITAVMPINIPLGMWVAVAGQENPNEYLADFSRLVAINLIPALFFVAAAWGIARAGYGLVPTIAGAYTVWGIALALLFVTRDLMGF
jgi:hypothetical protein